MQYKISEQRILEKKKLRGSGVARIFQLGGHERGQNIF